MNYFVTKMTMNKYNFSPHRRRMQKEYQAEAERYKTGLAIGQLILLLLFVDTLILLATYFNQL